MILYKPKHGNGKGRFHPRPGQAAALTKRANAMKITLAPPPPWKIKKEAEMMYKCFVVIGSTGEYSDRDEWAVRVVHTEDRAKEFIRELKAAYLSVPTSGYGYMRNNMEDVTAALADLDPEFKEDYTGTTWDYRECPIEATKRSE